LRILTLSARRGSSSVVLSDARALALARIVLRVQWVLGEGQDPYDVEWVYDGERFWLVQARPVTRLPHVTPAPVRHLPVIWSNANLKDAVAGVPSTLGWSIIQPVLRSIVYTYVQVTGYQVPEGMEIIRRLEGRAYFDLTAMQWLMYDALGFTPAEVNVTMGGMQPEIPVPGDPWAGREGNRRKLARIRLLKQLWQSARVYEREIARVRALVDARTRDDISGLSNPGIIAWRNRTNDVAIAFSRLFQLNNAGSLWDKLLTDLIEKVRPGDGLRIASALLAATNGVVTAEHGYRSSSRVRARGGRAGQPYAYLGNPHRSGSVGAGGRRPNRRHFARGSRFWTSLAIAASTRSRSRTRAGVKIRPSCWSRSGPSSICMRGSAGGSRPPPGGGPPSARRGRSRSGCDRLSAGWRHALGGRQPCARLASRRWSARSRSRG
jgi:pyruvate,water dikinase